MRNVFITQGNLGDVVCCIPVVEQIKRNRPDLTMAVICPEEYAGLFAFNPHVDYVNCDIRRDDQIYGMRWPLARHERAIPFVDWFAGLAGISVLENRLPTVYSLDREELDWSFAPGDVVVAVGPQTRWPTRNWPSARYEEVLASLKKSHDVKVVAVGMLGASEAPSYLRMAHRSYLDEPSIRKTAAVLARSSCFLGNDSGLAHLAVACRTTAFTIFGPVHHRTHAHPGWTVPIQNTEGCHGCLTDGRELNFPVEHYCPCGSECLSKVAPEHVLERVVPFISDVKSGRVAQPLEKTKAIPSRISSGVAPEANARAESLDVSILVCCYRFLQRFKVFLQCLAAQTLGRDRFEIVVTNPQSPDGLSEFIRLYNQGGRQVVQT